MPEHTSWFTYLVSLPAIRDLEHRLNPTAVYPAGTPVTLEYTALMVFVILLVLAITLIVRARIVRTRDAIIPEGRLTLASLVENIAEIFYGTLKGMLGGNEPGARGEQGRKDAKFFLPLIGTCAVFIFFSNAIALLPGFAAPTSNFNVTLACGLVIFVATHYYGVKRTGLAYFKHFVGPFWWLAPLMIPVEVLSHTIRPATLATRLAMNMHVDHLLVGVFTSLTYVIVPVAIMLLGVLVVVVQTYVFCLLSTIYISLAIEHHDEHEEHGAAHGHAAPHHGHAGASIPLPGVDPVP
jgi:F-type H+-transporting ATPase subunit a